MVRIVGGLVAGIVVFLGILVLFEFLARQASPRPSANALYAIVAAAYFLSALAGGLAAGLIARRIWPIWAIALLVMLGVLWTLAETGHPLWMQIASLLAPLVAGLAASAIAHRRLPAAAA